MNEAYGFIEVRKDRLRPVGHGIHNWLHLDPLLANRFGIGFGHLAGGTATHCCTETHTEAGARLELKSYSANNKIGLLSTAAWI